MAESVLISAALGSNPYAVPDATDCPFCRVELNERGDCLECGWARSCPYFEVTKVCRPPDEATRRTPLWAWHHGCGRIWTGLSHIPAGPDEPPRHHPCDRCIDRMEHERAVMLAKQTAERTGQPITAPEKPQPF